MPIVLLCPGCMTRLTLRDDRAGTTVDCPQCETAITVPILLSSPPTAPPPQEVDYDDDLLPPSVPTPSKSEDATRSDETAPRRKSRRRRHRDAEDEDDQPKRRRASSRKVYPWVIATTLGCFLALCLASRVLKNNPADTSQNGNTTASYQKLEGDMILELLDHPERYKGKKIALSVMPMIHRNEFITSYAGRDLWFEGGVWSNNNAAPNGSVNREFEIVIRLPQDESEIPHRTGNFGVTVYFTFSGSLRKGNVAAFVK